MAFSRECAAGTPVLTDQGSHTICSLSVGKIATTDRPLLLLSQEQVFAFHFAAVQRSLELRQYERAAALLQRYFNYRDGASTPAYWFSIYVIKGRPHDFFIEAYRAQFCAPSTYLPLGAEDSQLPRVYAKALEAAIAGDYVESHRLALLAFDQDKSIEFPLLLAGVVDIVLKRPAEARTEWLSVLNARRVLYPEQIGPSGPQIQAAEFLIHFRP